MNVIVVVVCASLVVLLSQGISRELVVPLMMLVAAGLRFSAYYLHSSPLPRQLTNDDLEGTQFWGNAEIDGFGYAVYFVVDNDKLAIIGIGAGFSLLMNMEALELTKQRRLVGYRVIITSSDAYMEHLFKRIIVSSRVASKLVTLSCHKVKIIESPN